MQGKVQRMMRRAVTARRTAERRITRGSRVAATVPATMTVKLMRLMGMTREKMTICWVLWSVRRMYSCQGPAVERMKSFRAAGAGSDGPVGTNARQRPMAMPCAVIWGHMERRGNIKMEVRQ
jgi:hypothetical protein